MEQTQYQPGWKYYLAVWGTLSILAGAQGWFTGDAVMMVLRWLGH